jgi:histidinol dehydrogenase
MSGLFERWEKGAGHEKEGSAAVADALAIRRIDTRQDDFAAALAALRGKLSPFGEVVSEASRRRTIEVFGEPLSPQQVVERICGEVSRRGLAAVLEYSQKLDKASLTPTTLRVSESEMAAAHASTSPELLATIRRVRDQILEFQRALLPADVVVERPGVRLTQRFLPLDRVGVCVPGGAAAYPSTVLMTVVPAQAAGVREIAVVAPPTPSGANHPLVQAVCYELGVRELYRVGGAQAVAALAWGVEGLPRVDKIVGPGNLFVTLAKRHVYGLVDIDALAGPSEVVVVADGTTPPEFAAADLLAQAEHAPGASILVTWDAATLQAVAAQIERQVSGLARASQTRQALEEFGCLILVRDEEEAAGVVDLIAPEHLHLAVEGAQRLLGKVRHAGAIFLGPYSPVAVGDYVAGPSHVLPTSGTARWASGLSALSFLRGGSVIEYTASALATAAEDVVRLAAVEGLTAHAASVRIRCR